MAKHKAPYSGTVLKVQNFQPLTQFILQSLLNRAIDRELYLITQKSKFYGLVKVAKASLLDNFFQLAQLDGDSFCVFSFDQSRGIYLDFYIDDKVYFELTAWGW